MALPDSSNITFVELDIGSTSHSINTEKGIFMYLSELDLQGLILNAAQGASSRNSSTFSYAKLDKRGYVYLNSSYGVGAPIGLVENLGTAVSSYKYNETGFHALPLCI